ncbi:hypothetical protein ABZY58_11470 [Micromonospora tulbaghiae]
MTKPRKATPQDVARVKEIQRAAAGGAEKPADRERPREGSDADVRDDT